MKNGYMKIISLRTFSVLRLCGLVFFAIVIFNGCKKDEKPVDMGYNYFPDNIGHYCIYDVDSTVYDDFNHDTVEYRYEIKEVIESYFTDNQGRQAMRVERYRKNYNDTIPYSSMPWGIPHIVSFTKTKTTGEKNEDNVRFIRLAFPTRKAKTWNGNEYNMIGEWDCKYDDVDFSYSLNSMNFDSTLFVRQLLDTNLLYYLDYSERYARNVGLIEKKMINVADTALCCGSVLGRIDSGTIYTQKLIDWGPR